MPLRTALLALMLVVASHAQVDPQQGAIQTLAAVASGAGPYVGCVVTSQVTSGYVSQDTTKVGGAVAIPCTFSDGSTCVGSSMRMSSGQGEGCSDALTELPLMFGLETALSEDLIKSAGNLPLALNPVTTLQSVLYKATNGAKWTQLMSLLASQLRLSGPEALTPAFFGNLLQGAAAGDPVSQQLQAAAAQLHNLVTVSGSYLSGMLPKGASVAEDDVSSIIYFQLGLEMAQAARQGSVMDLVNATTVARIVAASKDALGRVVELTTSPSGTVATQSTPSNTQAAAAQASETVARRGMRETSVPLAVLKKAAVPAPQTVAVPVNATALEGDEESEGDFYSSEDEDLWEQMDDGEGVTASSIGLGGFKLNSTTYEDEDSADGGVAASSLDLPLASNFTSDFEGEEGYYDLPGSAAVKASPTIDDEAPSVEAMDLSAAPAVAPAPAAAPAAKPVPAPAPSAATADAPLNAPIVEASDVEEPLVASSPAPSPAQAPQISEAPAEDSEEATNGGEEEKKLDPLELAALPIMGSFGDVGVVSQPVALLNALAAKTVEEGVKHAGDAAQGRRVLTALARIMAVAQMDVAPAARQLGEGFMGVSEFDSYDVENLIKLIQSVPLAI